MGDMSNFFERLFGKKPRTEVPETAPSREAASDAQQEDPAILELRERNFQATVEGYLRRAPTEREMDVARRVVTDAKTGKLAAISREEMLGLLQDAETRIQLRPTPEPENVIDGVEFEPRGNRQINFETRFAQALGREVTADDLAEAERYIDEEPGRREAFENMIGEEVATFADSVARQLMVRKLRGEEGEASEADDQRREAA